MTQSQRDALELLATGNRETTAHTHGRFIGGRTAACLIRMGLARRVADGVEITPAGRAALATKEGNPPQ